MKGTENRILQRLLTVPSDLEGARALLCDARISRMPSVFCWSAAARAALKLLGADFDLHSLWQHRNYGFSLATEDGEPALCIFDKKTGRNVAQW